MKKKSIIIILTILVICLSISGMTYALTSKPTTMSSNGSIGDYTPPVVPAPAQFKYTVYNEASASPYIQLTGLATVPTTPFDLVIPATILHNGKSINVLEIGSGAFQGYKLNSIMFLGQIWTIHPNAFNGITGTSIIMLPTGVGGISAGAFANSSVTHFVFGNVPPTMPTAGGRALGDPSRITILVNDFDLDKFKTAVSGGYDSNYAGWTDYASANIITK